MFSFLCRLFGSPKSEVDAELELHEKFIKQTSSYISSVNKLLKSWIHAHHSLKSGISIYFSNKPQYGNTVDRLVGLLGEFGKVQAVVQQQLRQVRDANKMLKKSVSRVKKASRARNKAAAEYEKREHKYKKAFSVKKSGSPASPQLQKAEDSLTRAKARLESRNTILESEITTTLNRTGPEVALQVSRLLNVTLTLICPGSIDVPMIKQLCASIEAIQFISPLNRTNTMGAMNSIKESSSVIISPIKMPTSQVTASFHETEETSTPIPVQRNTVDTIIPPFLSSQGSMPDMLGPGVVIDHAAIDSNYVNENTSPGSTNPFAAE